jgi:hypothetical protein
MAGSAAAVDGTSGGRAQHHPQLLWGRSQQLTSNRYELANGCPNRWPYTENDVIASKQSTNVLGRASMQTVRNGCQPPDLSAEQRLSSDLARRIRKLRWLGMQQEAEQLQMTLRRGPHTECVIVVPRDTD